MSEEMDIYTNNQQYGNDDISNIFDTFGVNQSDRIDQIINNFESPYIDNYCGY